MKKTWKLINPKDGESASIIYNPNTQLYSTQFYPGKNYLSATGMSIAYHDNFRSLRGAKISMTKYLGFKTKWKEES